MTEPEEIFGKVVREYYLLRMLNPEDNLLKYFIMDANGFRQNQDIMMKIEFLKNFKRGMQTLDDFIGERTDVPFFEYMKYGKELVCSLLQNYCDAMENKIELYDHIINN